MMNHTSKNVPVLRFKGYSDEWQQKKLGDLVTFHNGDRGHNYPQESEIVKDGIPFINAGDLVNGKINIENCKRITIDKFNSLRGAKMKIGDIVYCLRGTLGKNAINTNISTGTIASSLVLIRPTNINNYYLFQVLNSDYGDKQVIKFNEGAVQPNLSVKNLKNFMIPYSSTQEQNKIANLMSLITQNLTLQQVKLEQLKLLEKSLRQNILSNKKDQTKINFKKFSTQWKVEKLKNITNRLDNLRKPIAASKRTVGTTPYYGANGIQDYVKGYTHNGENILVAEDGANNFYPYPTLYTTGKIWVNNHAHVIRAKNKNVNNKFLSEILKMTYFVPYLVGGTRAKLTAKNLMNISLNLPPLEEQNNIAIFLTNIQTSIRYQKNKINELLKVKKFLLQNMFI